MSDTVKGFKIWEPLLLAIVVVIGMFAGSKMAVKSGKVFKAKSDTGSISEIIRFIEEQYVDSLGSEELVAAAMQSILGNLDPHSGYFSPDELRDVNERMEGRFDGIGIQFHLLRDTVVVLFVNEDGPAEKAGIEQHDRILMADDKPLTDLELTEEELVSTLRGKTGSTVRLQIRRDGVDSLLHYEVVRGQIPIESVISSCMLDVNTGYIKLSHFSSTTYKEFMTALEALVQEEGMKHLVIDLRDNPGGYLKEAVNILSQLFDEKGKLLVYTEGDHSKRMEYRSTGKPFYAIDNIVVMIDGGSASASEIIAGAIQDHDRGVVIGSKSYGKGLVQEQFPLSNGGALRLTIARYYTPSGRSIQRPYTSLAENGNGQSSRDSTAVYKTQSGRPVQADGGIDPDIYVDPAFDWYKSEVLVGYGDLLDYMFYGFEDVYRDHHTTVKAYLGDLPSEDVLKQDLKDFLEVRDTEANQFDDEWPRCYMTIRAMAVSAHFGRQAWYEVINTEDPVVAKALEIIELDRAETLRAASENGSHERTNSN